MARAPLSQDYKGMGKDATEKQSQPARRRQGNAP